MSNHIFVLASYPSLLFCLCVCDGQWAEGVGHNGGRRATHARAPPTTPPPSPQSFLPIPTYLSTAAKQVAMAALAEAPPGAGVVLTPRLPSALAARRARRGRALANSASDDAPPAQKEDATTHNAAPGGGATPEGERAGTPPRGGAPAPAPAGRRWRLIGLKRMVGLR